MDGTKFCLTAGMVPGVLYLVDMLARSGRLECVIVQQAPPPAGVRAAARNVAKCARDLFRDPRSRQAAVLRQNLPDYADRHVLRRDGERRLRSLAEQHGLDLFVTDAVNTDQAIHRYLSRSQSRHVLNLGGKILRPAVLNSFGGTWLNCHGGYLPYYRGMWSEYWAVKNRDFDKIGWTIHELVERLDAGKIFERGTIPCRPGETLEELMLRNHAAMIAAYIRFAERLPDSAVGGEPFKAEKANYYSRPKGVSLARLRRTRVDHL